MKLFAAIRVFALSASICAGTSAAELPPKAPPAESPATYLTQQQLASVLRASIAAGQDPALSQIASTDEYFINQVHRAKPAVPYAHAGWTEVHIILKGSGTLITGGHIDTGTHGAKIITGGVTRHVAAGDVIIVPAATPHWYSQIDGALDAIEVRFITPAAATRQE